MAKYTYDYACGHGQGETVLFGKTSERARKLEWLSGTRVCRECYIRQSEEQDAKAEKVVTLTLPISQDGEVRLLLVLSGQISANKETIKVAGFQWGELEGGYLDLLSTQAPSKAYHRVFKARSEKELETVLTEITGLAAGMGYRLRDNINPVDLLAFRQSMAAIAEKDRLRAEVAASDPAPPASSLRLRIKALEKETGATWNGKIYGRKGSYNFYVNNTRHDASDEEVADREQNIKEFAAWKSRHPELA